MWKEVRLKREESSLISMHCPAYNAAGAQEDACIRARQPGRNVKRRRVATVVEAFDSIPVCTTPLSDETIHSRDEGPISGFRGIKPDIQNWQNGLRVVCPWGQPLNFGK